VAPRSNELEFGVRDDRFDRGTADVARSPLAQAVEAVGIENSVTTNGVADLEQSRAFPPQLAP